ncbi:MAG: Rrf2 family transcriptional regulator [Elusimicrobia bacterium]|nr:Rrf2 family transcriptional regulator [Elusimicrobiota bacterium]
MLFLAKRPGNGFCLVEDAAKAQKLPKNYLSKIFQRLGRRGLLVSQRGPGGGYALARPARKISLSEIVRSLEEPRPAWRECLLELRGCVGNTPCLIHEAVLRSEKVLREALEKASLADAARNAGG